jgi:hypothetical protein
MTPKINTNRKKYSSSFAALSKEFEQMLRQWNPVKHKVSVEEYFGERKGKATSLRLLRENKIVPLLEDPEKEDFPGIYIFFKGEDAIYVGISQKIVQRIQQHVKGRSHYSASFAFRIAKEHYDRIEDEALKTRDSLDFDTYCVPVQLLLREMDVAILPIEDPTTRYLFEVYCAVTLGTPYNDFETH